MTVPDRQNDEALTELLLRWQDADEGTKKSIEEEVRDVFEVTRAIFVLDMSGFSASVIKHDIIHFLARIHQMRNAVVPLVEEHGGQFVKYVADDVVAVFPDVDHALEASERIIAMSLEEGIPRGAGTGFQVAIGIGFGAFLHVPGRDVWGAEVNAAFKLGEDVAGPGELMMTQPAIESLPEARRQGFEAVPIQVSGVSLTAYLRRI